MRDVGFHFKKLLEDEQLTGHERIMLSRELTRQLKEIDDRYADEKRTQD